MKSMGKKMSMTETVCGNMEKMHYPSFNISSDMLPEVEDYKVGDIIEMTIECKVKGIRESYDNKKCCDCELEMKKAEITNLKEERKEAKRLGLDKEDYDALQKKKEKIKNA